MARTSKKPSQASAPAKAAVKAPLRQASQRGRPALPMIPPFAVVERMVETYDARGALCRKTMYLPACWRPDASLPTFFPADPHTPWTGGQRGKRRWRMFTTRYRALKWLLDQQQRLVTTSVTGLAAGGGV